MKLQELNLVEMPIKIKAFPEYSQTDIDHMILTLANAQIVDVIEVDYELIEKDDMFGLRKGDKILAFAKIAKVDYFSAEYLKLLMIYVLPEHRKEKLGTIMLHAIKETSSLPLICDDVISDAGFNLLLSLKTKQTVFKMKSMDKKSGDIADFKNGDEKNMDLAIIIENKSTGLFREGMYPGDPDKKMYLKFIR